MNENTQIFDKNKLKSKISVIILKNVPIDRITDAVKIFSNFFPNIKNFKCIINHDFVDGKSISKTIIIDLIKVGDINFSNISEHSRQKLNKVIKSPVTIQIDEIQIGYTDMSYNDVLSQLLPENVGIPHSFEQTGHIAHLNLNTFQEPYKKIIGTVLIDKTPGIKTVVSKIGQIDTVFRTFKMEIIAGIQNTEVEIHQSNCTFKFDYEKVYWNSRLDTEHNRLVNKFLPDEIVVDMFAGIGPFAIPAGKNKVRVFANDLNPDSYKWLKYNIEKNKVNKFVTPFNLDGIEFIKLINSMNIIPDHVVMNLPASSLEFLSSVIQIFNNKKTIIHLYTFVNSVNGSWISESGSIIKQISPDIVINEIYDVRQISPNTHMMCIQLTCV